jgi:hypothetical protein
MASLLRINHFVESANRAYASVNPKYLRANRQEMGVCQLDLPGSFNAEDRELNRETWRIFRESLVNTLGQGKFNRICHRYPDRFNFNQMQAQGEPMRPEHVELFSIGASQILTSDIKARFPQKISTLTREQLTTWMRVAQPFPIVGWYKDPMRIGGSPTSFAAHFCYDKLLMDKERQLLLSDIGRLTFPAWLERFSKAIANRELIEGQLIPAPGQDGRIDYYKVFRKIGTGDGLVSYALRPATSNSTLKPLVVFRSTPSAPSSEDAFEAYLNDVQWNVGEMGWKAASREFQTLMSDPHFRANNEKVCLAGYSLGGAHAQYFLAQHADAISHAVFYSNPSVDDETAESFAKKINQAPRRTEPLKIEIYRTIGDFCHCVGSKHVGWGVVHPDVHVHLTEIEYEDKTSTAWQSLHSLRIFDNTAFPHQKRVFQGAQQLLHRLDNSSRGADIFWYEKVRRFWSRIAFYFFFGLSEIVKLISMIFGVKILRSSKRADL